MFNIYEFRGAERIRSSRDRKRKELVKERKTDEATKRTEEEKRV
jgi:hypothetical protein